MAEKIESIKEDIEAMQLNYDAKGYVSTNDADELIKHCKALIQTVEGLQIEIEQYKSMELLQSQKLQRIHEQNKKPPYMDLDD